MEKQKQRRLAKQRILVPDRRTVKDPHMNWLRLRGGGKVPK